MIILIDTREQRPYTFKDYPVNTQVATLKTGDYTLLDHENDICIERKSGTDFIQSITHNRKRFESEVQRMSGYEYSYIICEWELCQIFRYTQQYTRIKSADTVLSTVFSWQQRYNVSFHFFNGRNMAERAIYKIFAMYLRNTTSLGEQCSQSV
jgi:ERCC4-type nuclease